MLIELSGGNTTEYRQLICKVKELYNSIGIDSEGGNVIYTIKGEDYSEVKKLRIITEFKDFNFLSEVPAIASLLELFRNDKTLK